MREVGLGLLLALALSAARAQDDDAGSFIAFLREPSAQCVSRGGEQILVQNTHATRTIEVRLDRYQQGNGTGDRSRSVLAPGAEPEPLGCSQNSGGTQEWRVARARFVP